MAALAGDLSRQILSHTDAARAFRPWWDNLEDSLMYSLVIMGKFSEGLFLGLFHGHLIYFEN